MSSDLVQGFFFFFWRGGGGLGLSLGVYLTGCRVQLQALRAYLDTQLCVVCGLRKFPHQRIPTPKP